MTLDRWENRVTLLTPFEGEGAGYLMLRQWMTDSWECCAFHREESVFGAVNQVV